jgi:outer membrane protein OmpA-like peptidoglycan-associated protein
MRITLTLLFLLNTLLSYSQEDKALKKADKLFDDKNYYQALKFYDEALTLNKANPYTNFRVARCYIETYQKGKALQYAFDAVKLSEKPSSEMYFTLGQAYHINHQFDKAIESYQKSDPGRTNQKALSKLIQECNLGKKYISNPSDVKITNAGPLINTEYHEYLPYITADRSKLFFTSRRPGSTGGKQETDGQVFEDIYVADNKGGAWDKPINIGAPLNTDIHDACVGISEDGQTLFIYRGSNGGDIYSSELKGSRWSKPESLPVNTEFFETTACLSPDERTIFFVRKVMNGSRDIYICNRTLGGTWSKPKKMEAINTEFDEDAPFMHADGKTLYFSSKGHTSMGGYDVFKTVKNANGSWSVPVNLGSPINSAGNDVYFVLAADGKVGFYSSEKEGGFGKQDIYSIRMPASKDPALALIKGTVKDSKTGQPIEADITITDNESKETIAQYKSNSANGNYLISLPSGKNYGITIEKEGHLFHSENITLSDKDGFKEVTKEIKLADAKPGAKVVLNNIFFTSGKFDIRPESSLELQRLVKLMKTNPALRIEISGHTDNVGDAKANLALSEERAKSVMTFLITNGIEKSRLVAKGYGSSDPISSNDTLQGQQQNRRTEFKIIQ